jgi:large subunit ribosomal protein L18
MAKLSLFDRRRRRVRTALRARATGKPRLSVHRSGKHIYAQVIDDRKGATLAAASSLDEDVKG